MCKERKNDDDKGQADMISEFTCSIINCSNKSNDDYKIDYSLLNDNILSALNGDLDDTGDTDDGTDGQQSSD